MRKVLIFFSVLLLLLTSCELSYEKRNPAPQRGKVRILVYGNDFYKEFGASSKTTLPDAVNDAYSMGLALSALCEKAGYDYEVQYLLSPACATLRGIGADGNSDYQTVVQAIDALASDSKDNDMTILYFATHGKGSSKKLEYGSDIQSTRSICFSDKYSSTYKEMPINELMAMIEAIKGVKVVFGDFCFSGSMVGQGNVSAGSGDYDGLGLFELFSLGRVQCTESSSTFVLSAARYNEESHGGVPFGGQDHGHFTIAVLKALGWNEKEMKLEKSPVLDSKGRLTLLNIANYAKLNDGHEKQTPMASGGSADIVLFEF